jgi:hypothetical protein
LLGAARCGGARVTANLVAASGAPADIPRVGWLALTYVADARAVLTAARVDRTSAAASLADTARGQRQWATGLDTVLFPGANAHS